MIARRSLLSAVALGFLLASRAAAVRADDVRVSAETAIQIYEVRSPGAAAFLARRRLVQTLGLTYARVLGDVEEERAGRRVPRLAANVSLRLDQELGEDCLVTRDLCYVATLPGDPAFYQPLAEDTAIDAPEVWVEASGLPLDSRVRAGRQLHFDTIGLVRLDGASARAEPTGWLAAEVYGGLLVRRTSIAGTDAFAPQGIARIELDDVDRDRVPFLEEPATTWLAGGLVEVGDPRVARVRAGFREVQDEDGLVARRASLSVASQPVDPLRVSAAGVLDVHSRRVVDAWAEVRVIPHEAVTVRASGERHVPVFDWGSIWAYFPLVPIDEARLGADVRISDDVIAGAAGRVRHAEIEPGTDETDFGGEGHVGLEVVGTDVRLSGFAWDGDLGPLAAVMLDATRPLAWWVSADLRVSLWHFQDPVRGVLDGTSISEALGVRFRLSDPTTLRLELSHAHSPVVGHRFRALVLLSIEVWR